MDVAILDKTHDETLIDWFLSLAPAERLAELESRLRFFQSVQPDGAVPMTLDGLSIGELASGP